MKKKFIVIFLVIVGILIMGYWFYAAYFSKSDLNEKGLPKVVEEEQELLELFGSYYKKAQKVLSKMSLEEQVGQLFLVRYDRNLVSSQIQRLYPGGYILFAKDFQDQTKDSISKELSDHQSLSKYPLVFGVDEEGGIVTRVSRFLAFRDSKFPSVSEVYAEGGYDLLADIEKEKAELLLQLGIHLNLAPVADVSTDPNDFIYNRTLGKDASVTADYIKHMVEYANEAGISSCLKHFPGYGNNRDTHTGVVHDKRSYETFVKSDFLPFESGIQAGVPTILVSHNVVEAMDPDYPASLSSKVIKKLRDELGFSGIVLTDDLAMGAVSSYVLNGTAAVLAIQAGNDMIITSDFETMYQEVYQAVLDEIISKAVLERAVKRIIAWKYMYGLF